MSNQHVTAAAQSSLFVPARATFVSRPDQSSDLARRQAARRLSARCELSLHDPLERLGLRLWCAWLTMSRQSAPKSFGTRPDLRPHAPPGSCSLLLVTQNGRQRLEPMLPPSKSELEAFFDALTERVRPQDFVVGSPTALLGRALGLGDLLTDWCEYTSFAAPAERAALAAVACRLAARQGGEASCAGRWLGRLAQLASLLTPPPQRETARTAASAEATQRGALLADAIQPSGPSADEAPHPQAAQSPQPVLPPLPASSSPGGSPPWTLVGAAGPRQRHSWQGSPPSSQASSATLVGSTEDPSAVAEPPARSPSASGASRSRAGSPSPVPPLAAATVLAHAQAESPSDLLPPSGPATRAQLAAWRTACRQGSLPPTEQLATWLASWLDAECNQRSGDVKGLSALVFAMCHAEGETAAFRQQFGRAWRDMLARALAPLPSADAEPQNHARDKLLGAAWTLYSHLQAQLLGELAREAGVALLRVSPPRSVRGLELATALWLTLAGEAEPLADFGADGTAAVARWIRRLSSRFLIDLLQGLQPPQAMNHGITAAWCTVIYQLATMDAQLLANFEGDTRANSERCAREALSVAAPTSPAYPRAFSLACLALHYSNSDQALACLRDALTTAPGAPDYQSATVLSYLPRRPALLWKTDLTEPLLERLSRAELAHLSVDSLHHLALALDALGHIGSHTALRFARHALTVCRQSSQPYLLGRALAIALRGIEGDGAAERLKRQQRFIAEHSALICEGINAIHFDHIAADETSLLSAWGDVLQALRSHLFAPPSPAFRTPAGKDLYAALERANFLVPLISAPSDAAQRRQPPVLRTVASVHFTREVLHLLLEGHAKHPQDAVAALMRCEAIGRAPLCSAATNLLLEPETLASGPKGRAACDPDSNLSALEAYTAAARKGSSLPYSDQARARLAPALLDWAPAIIEHSLRTCLVHLLAELPPEAACAPGPAQPAEQAKEGGQQKKSLFLDSLISVLDLMALRNAYRTWRPNERAMTMLRRTFALLPATLQPDVSLLLQSRATFGSPGLCGHLMDFAIHAFAGDKPGELAIDSCHALVAARRGGIRFIDRAFAREVRQAECRRKVEQDREQLLHMRSALILRAIARASADGDTDSIPSAGPERGGELAFGQAASEPPIARARPIFAATDAIVEDAASRDDDLFAAFAIVKFTHNTLVAKGGALAEEVAVLQLASLLRPRPPASHDRQLTLRDQMLRADACLRGLVAPALGMSLALEVHRQLSPSWAEFAASFAEPALDWSTAAPKRPVSKASALEVRRLQQRHAWQQVLNSLQPDDFRQELAALFALSSGECLFGKALVSEREAMAQVLAEPTRLEVAESLLQNQPPSEQPSKRFAAEWKKITARAHELLAWRTATLGPLPSFGASDAATA